jgi:hypothetical protein
MSKEERERLRTFAHLCVLLRGLCGLDLLLPQRPQELAKARKGN